MGHWSQSPIKPKNMSASYFTTYCTYRRLRFGRNPLCSGREALIFSIVTGSALNIVIIAGRKALSSREQLVRPIDAPKAQLNDDLESSLFWAQSAKTAPNASKSSKVALRVYRWKNLPKMSSRIA